jgi:hypothetical protein
MAHTWLTLFPVPAGMRAIPLAEPEMRQPVGLVWLDRRPEPILPRALISTARDAGLEEQLAAVAG